LRREEGALGVWRNTRGPQIRRAKITLSLEFSLTDFRENHMVEKSGVNVMIVALYASSAIKECTKICYQSNCGMGS
jgi:hypothetical protein